MPHRASLAFVASLLLAGCASSGGGGSSPERSARGSPSSASAPSAPVDSSDAPALPAKGLKVGWMDYRPPKKAGQVQTLTLLSQGTEEGRLIQRGRARMEGGKVVDDRTAAELLRSFEDSGFDRFALKRHPNDQAPGALQVVWIDRGNGFECLYLMPGARQNPETRDSPDVFDGLKKVIFVAHQMTPGSMVITGEGWSGDSMMNQQPGKKDR